MALPFTPSKRPFECHPMESNGRGKWQKTSSSAPQTSQFKVTPGSVIFRVLCPSSKSGSVIGKGGGIVAKIRHETGAKIKLEEIIPGCDERIVVISGLAKDSELRNEQSKQDDSDSNADGGEDGKVSAEDGKEKENSTFTEDSKLVKATSLVQKALLLIFERIVEGEPENDDADEAYKKSSPSIRLLVFSNQVGCLLGKGGSVIKQMSTDSGAQIRILPRDKLPLCSSPHDEIVQITGGVGSLRKALQSVSQQLMENPPRDRDFPSDNPPGSSSHPFAPVPRPEAFNPTNYHMPAQGSVIFRVLCPSSKSGSVIGKGGGIVAKIRHETGAKIKLEEIIPGCDERIVVISGLAKDSELRNEQSKQDDSDSNADGGEDGKVSAEDGKEKENSTFTEDSKLVKATSLVQKALLLIFERIVEGEPENDDADEANKKSSPSIRLLVFSNQVGCLLGKGGSVIKQMSTDSGAQIRILPRDKLPLCSSPHDEIVQITGGVGSLRKALQSVSQQLMENPPRDRDFPSDNPPGSSSHPFAPVPRPEAFNPTNYHMPAQGPPFPNSRPPFDAPYLLSFPKFHEGPVPGQMPVAPEVLVFRLLCSNDKVGSVIGKGGNIVKTLQHETGCEIKILETPSKTENRIIVISGPALPGDRISPAQDAVLRVQHRILMAAPDNKDNSVLSRLLVTPNQTGCLLGKGGSIIAEMRRLSGAHIRVLSKDQILKGVSEIDEIVQVSGEFGAVQEALLHITARLRAHLFRDKASALNHSAHPAFLDQMPQFGSYMGRREPSPPRLYGGLPPFQKDAGARAHDERSAFAHSIHGSGVSPLGAERVPPAPWAP